MKQYLKISLIIVSMGLLSTTFAFSNSDTREPRKAVGSERDEILKARWGNSDDNQRPGWRKNSLTVDKATIDKAAQAARKFRNVSDSNSDPSSTNMLPMGPAADASVNTSVNSGTVVESEAPVTPSTPTLGADAVVNTPMDIPKVEADPTPLSQDTTEKSADTTSEAVDQAATVVDSPKTTEDQANAAEDKAAAVIESVDQQVPEYKNLRSDQDSYLTPSGVLKTQ